MNNLDLNIGARVHYRDSLAGKLVKVVVDPSDLRVNGLIVESGILLKHARVFPIRKVEHADEKDIYLSLNSLDEGEYPEYHEKEFERPAMGWEHPKYEIDYVLFPGHTMTYTPTPTVKEKLRQGIPSELEVVKQGTPIKNYGGTIGKLDQIITTNTKEIAFLVMLRGAVLPERIHIPVVLVESVREDGILVDISDEELNHLAKADPASTPPSLF
jgi:uncharacterized protein YrrD